MNIPLNIDWQQILLHLLNFVILAGGLYLLLYSIGRFLIEFLRSDPRGAVGALSTSQFIALFTAAAAIVLLISRKRGKTHG